VSFQRRIFRLEMHSPGIAAEVNIDADGCLNADGDTAGVCCDAKCEPVANTWQTWYIERVS
jgi:hypothetical protein